MVFLELKRRGLEVYYFSDQDKRETDFVARQNNQTQAVIQVCWSLENESVRQREVENLKAALVALKEKTGLILTDNEEGEIKLGDKVIKIMPVYEWLLE